MFSSPGAEILWPLFWASVLVAVATRLVRLITGQPVWQVSIGETVSAFVGCIFSAFLVALLFDSSLGWHVSNGVFFLLLVSGCLSGSAAGAYLWHHLRR